jgi:hypothetical protein
MDDDILEFPLDKNVCKCGRQGQLRCRPRVDYHLFHTKKTIFADTISSSLHQYLTYCTFFVWTYRNHYLGFSLSDNLIQSHRKTSGFRHNIASLTSTSALAFKHGRSTNKAEVMGWSIYWKNRSTVCIYIVLF